MTKIEVYVDDAGKFWETELEARMANERLKDNELKDDITLLLGDAFGWRMISPGYLVDVRIGDLTDAMFNRPEEFLRVLWKVTKYKFNKKFNESSAY